MLRATSRACGRAHRLAPPRPRRLVVDTPRAASTDIAAPRANAPDAAAAIAAAGVPANVAATLAKGVPPDAVRTLPQRLAFLGALGVRDIGAAASSHPQLLEYDVERTMAPLSEYLLNLGVADVGKLVGRAPAIFGCDVSFDLHRKVSVLQALGVVGVAKWLTNNPRLYTLDMERDIRPAVEYLRAVENLEVGRVIERAGLCAFDVEATRTRLDFLRTLDVPEPKRGWIVSRWPQILSTPVEGNLQCKADWLREKGFTMPNVLLKNPTIFSMPIETNLAPKLEYLVSEMEVPIEDIQHFARILNYSVEHLASRHEFLALMDRKRVRLHRTYRSSAHTFATKIAGSSNNFYQQVFLPEMGFEKVAKPAGGEAFMLHHNAKLDEDDVLRARIQTTRDNMYDAILGEDLKELRGGRGAFTDELEPGMALEEGLESLDSDGESD